MKNEKILLRSLILLITILMNANDEIPHIIITNNSNYIINAFVLYSNGHSMELIYPQQILIFKELFSNFDQIQIKIKYNYLATKNYAKQNNLNELLDEIDNINIEDLLIDAQKNKSYTVIIEENHVPEIA